MTYEEVLSALKLRKTVRREGRALRLLGVGFVDVTKETKRTEITKEDRDATDWEVDPG